MFNPDSVPKERSSSSDLAPIPDGDYLTTVTRCAFVDDDKSSRIELELTIPEGLFAKRKVWSNMAVEGAQLKPSKLESERYLAAAFVDSTGIGGWKSLQEAKDVCQNALGNDVIVTLKSNKSKTDGKIFVNVVEFFNAKTGLSRAGKPSSVNKSDASNRVSSQDNQDVPF